MARGGKRQGAGRKPINENEIRSNVIRVSDQEKLFIEFARIKNINLDTVQKFLLKHI